MYRTFAMRTFHLLRTVPQLTLCDLQFNQRKDVIFALTMGDLLEESIHEDSVNAFETSFRTLDAQDYSSIATVDVRRTVTSLAINPLDTLLAVVETNNANGDHDNVLEDAVVRLYEVGMTRQEEDDLQQDDEDEEQDDEFRDTDSSSASSSSNNSDDDGGDNDDDGDDYDDDDAISLHSYSPNEYDSDELFELSTDNPDDPQGGASLHAWLQQDDDDDDDDESGDDGDDDDDAEEAEEGEEEEEGDDGEGEGGEEEEDADSRMDDSA